MSSKPSRSITTQMEIRRFKDQYPPAIFFARMFMSSWYELMREIELAFSHSFLEKVLRSEYLNQPTVILISMLFPHSGSKERNQAAIKRTPSSRHPVRSEAHLKKLTEPRKSPITKPKSAVRNAKPMPLLSELHPNQLFSAEVYFKLFQELAPAPLEFTVFATALEENQALVKSYEKKPPPSIIAIITYLEQCSKYHIVIKPEVLLQPFHFHGSTYHENVINLVKYCHKISPLQTQPFDTMSETGIFEDLIHTMNLPEKIVKIAHELLEQKDAFLMRSIRVRIGLAIVQAIDQSSLHVKKGWRSYKIAQYLHIAKSSLYSPLAGKQKKPKPIP